jgi:hypothetical protein
MWVKEISEGREKVGNSTLFFLSCWNNRAVCDYFIMLPEIFWYILKDITDDIKKQSHFRKCLSPEVRLAVTLRQVKLYS